MVGLEKRRMRLRGHRSIHQREVIWMVVKFGKRGRVRDSSRMRVEMQYGVMRMLSVLRSGTIGNTYHMETSETYLTYDVYDG